MRASKRSRRSSSSLPIHDLMKSYPLQSRRSSYFPRFAPLHSSALQKRGVDFVPNNKFDQSASPYTRSVKYALKSSNDYLFSFYQIFLKVPKTHFRVPRSFPFVELGSIKGKSLLHVQQITRIVIFNSQSSLQRKDCIFTNGKFWINAKRILY